MLDKQGNSNTEERMDLIDRFEAEFPAVQVKYLTAEREFIGKTWFIYLMLSPAIPMLIRIKESFQISSVFGKTKQKATCYFRDLPMVWALKTGL